MQHNDMKYWLINAICGVLVLVLLGMHMAGMHLDDLLALVTGATSEPLAWDEVASRGRSPVYMGSYVVLLGAALFHGLYGLHTMLIEAWSGRRAARLVLVGCWAAGLILFVVGTTATFAFFVLERAG